jgi:hypothetical protein
MEKVRAHVRRDLMNCVTTAKSLNRGPQVFQESVVAPATRIKLDARSVVNHSIGRTNLARDFRPIHVAAKVSVSKTLRALEQKWVPSYPGHS